MYNTSHGFKSHHRQTYCSLFQNKRSGLGSGGQEDGKDRKDVQKPSLGEQHSHHIYHFKPSRHSLSAITDLWNQIFKKYFSDLDFLYGIKWFKAICSYQFIGCVINEREDRLRWMALSYDVGNYLFYLLQQFNNHPLQKILWCNL